MIDRRSHTRYVIGGKVVVRRTKEPFFTMVLELVDISFSGFSAVLEKQLEIGSLVEFELTTELMSQALPGKGKIKYLAIEEKKDSPSLFRVGVEFLELDRNIFYELIGRIQKKACAKPKINRVIKGTFTKPV